MKLCTCEIIRYNSSVGRSEGYKGDAGTRDGVLMVCGDGGCGFLCIWPYENVWALVRELFADLYIHKDQETLHSLCKVCLVVGELFVYHESDLTGAAMVEGCLLKTHSEKFLSSVYF